MEPVNCIRFCYLGTTRYVICDLDTNYEQMQRHVAQTFRLPEECISAIQFTDGRGYLFNKELFEYFLILFPQPEQKFFVRLECSRILEYRIAYKEGKSAPFSVERNTNKRKLRDIQETDQEDRFGNAAPVRRQNCFLGEMPGANGGSMDGSQSSDATGDQPRKRLRLMKLKRKPMKKCVKPPQGPNSVFRLERRRDSSAKMFESEQVFIRVEIQRWAPVYTSRESIKITDVP